MLSIHNLSIYSKIDLQLLIDNLTFSVNDGDKIAVIGEEGNGKSLLFKAIYNYDLIKDFADIKGEINKKDEIIGYLPQSIDDKFLSYSSKRYFEEKIDPYLLDYNLYYRLLFQMNFNQELITDEIYLKDLSGGEKIKFLLLIEMLKNPTILLLDEPTNDLDLDSILWIEDFMLNLQIPLVFISHDLSLLENVSNRIIHLERIMRRKKARHTVSNLGYNQYINERERSIYNQTKNAKKDKEEFDKKMDRYRKVHDSVEDHLSTTKSSNPNLGKNLKDKMHTVKSMGKRLEKEKENLTERPDYEEGINLEFKDIEIPSGKEILNLRLDQLKAGEKVLSKNIHLQIIGPEKICIVGKNGSGKTSLIKETIKELEGLNLKIGYMPQSYFDHQDKDKTVIDYLSQDYTKEEHSKISTYLGSLKFTREEMMHTIRELSGGQKAKVYFAKMNLRDKEVLVLDEPTRNLSVLSQPEIIESLKNFKGAIIAVSHDRKLIKEVFEKVYQLSSDGLKRIKIKKFHGGFYE